jgi:hypothetical protein
VILAENDRAGAVCENRNSPMWATFRLPEQGCSAFRRETLFLHHLARPTTNKEI